MANKKKQPASLPVGADKKRGTGGKLTRQEVPRKHSHEFGQGEQGGINLTAHIVARERGGGKSERPQQVDRFWRVKNKRRGILPEDDKPHDQPAVRVHRASNPTTSKVNRLQGKTRSNGGIQMHDLCPH